MFHWVSQLFFLRVEVLFCGKKIKIQEEIKIEKKHPLFSFEVGGGLFPVKFFSFSLLFSVKVKNGDETENRK